MATRCSRIKDILENSSFALKFIDVYAGKMTAKEIIKESGLPAWFIYELFEDGVLSEDKIIQADKVNVILTAMYCYNNSLFIKNSFRNLNTNKKNSILRGDKDTPSIKWLKGRIENKINNGEKIEAKVLLKEVFSFYPQLLLHESRNTARLKKVIIIHKQIYRRKQQKYR